MRLLRPRRETLVQAQEMGFGSLLLVAGGMAFLGAVLLAHGALQAKKVVGNISLVGAAYFQLLVRELGPTFAGILAGIHIGASTSAQLASMKVTEQIDAWKMSAGEPYRDLVVPRVLAGLIALPCLVVVGTSVAAITTAVLASTVYGADGRAFLDATFVRRGDIFAFFSKSCGYGIGIPLVACLSGLKAHGGAAAVGLATTRGVVMACLLVLITNGVFSLFLFLAGW